jgi:hypothetical protein
MTVQLHERRLLSEVVSLDEERAALDVGAGLGDHDVPWPVRAGRERHDRRQQQHEKWRQPETIVPHHILQKGWFRTGDPSKSPTHVAKRGSMHGLARICSPAGRPSGETTRALTSQNEPPDCRLGPG